MSDLNETFDEHDDDCETETCSFCGRVYPGEDEEDFHDWWCAPECGHICCLECSDWSGSYPLCPRCAQEEKERNGKAT